MPNWCQNSLVVSGDRVELDRFKREHETFKRENWNGDMIEDHQILDFSVDTPYPANRDMSGDGWYEFHIENWSVKWQPDVHEMEDGETALYYEFMTPWRDPENWVFAAARRYPTLTFELTYFEEGMFFAGGLWVQNEEFDRFYAESADLLTATGTSKVLEDEWTDDDYYSFCEGRSAWQAEMMESIRGCG